MVFGFFFFITVPPSSPRIRSRGKDIIANGVIGPVAENEMIDLTCDTVGGKITLPKIQIEIQTDRLIDEFALGHPIPELTWWLNGNLIDSTYHTDHKDTVMNHLQDYKVIR